MKGLKSIALLGVLVMIVALAGCSEDNQIATSPIFAVAGGADDMANFVGGGEDTTMEGVDWLEDAAPPRYVYGADGDGTQSFWLTVPGAGDYVIEYHTWYGVFSVMFRTTRKASVQLFTNARDNFGKALIHEGTIPDGLEVVYDQGGVQAFGQIPYNTSMPSGFTATRTTLLFDAGMYFNINPDVGVCTHWRGPTEEEQGGPGVVDPPGAVRNGCWPWGPDWLDRWGDPYDFD
jgi:hypothetical protein